MGLKLILCVLSLMLITLPACGQYSADYWVNKGDSFFNQGKYSAAIQQYDMALRVDPSYAVAWHNKGSALHLLGLRWEALECYDMATKLDPGYAPSWGNAALAFYELGMNYAAQQCLNEYNRLNQLAGITSTVTYRQDYYIPGLGEVHVEPAYSTTYNPSQTETPGRVVFM